MRAKRGRGRGRGKGREDGAKGWATRRVSGWALFIDSNEKVAVGA